MIIARCLDTQGRRASKSLGTLNGSNKRRTDNQYFVTQDVETEIEIG